MKRASTLAETTRSVAGLALAISCWAAVGGIARAQTAGPVYPTIGVYDESTIATNSVDAIAAGTNLGTTVL